MIGIITADESVCFFGAEFFATRTTGCPSGAPPFPVFFSKKKKSTRGYNKILYPLEIQMILK